VALVCAATFLVTAGHARLPRLMRDPVSAAGSLHQYVAGCIALISVAALMVLWIRRGSVLDLWLMVVLCDYVIEICLLMFPVANRYTLGWYAGRIFGLISASVVLFVLLYEITALYARLRLLNEELEQRVVERTTQLMQASEALREAQAELAHINRVTAMGQLAASITHEVMQPIAAGINGAQAACAGWAPSHRICRRSGRRSVIPSMKAIEPSTSSAGSELSSGRRPHAGIPSGSTKQSSR
jgi:signal transduction histidine kinase